MLPWNSPLAVDAISSTSIFNMLVLDAYDEGNVAAPVPYGVVTYASSAAATFIFTPLSIPTTVSPTTNGI